MKRRGFTLLELLVCVGIIALLAALLLPAINKSKDSARGAKCVSNLRQLGLATALYLDEYGRFFPYFDTVAGGRLWYFGLESPYNPGGAPGTRSIDLTQAKLYPYFRTQHGIEVCPSYNYQSSLWRQKFNQITDGYGLNNLLFAVSPNQWTNSPSGLVCFADTADVNTIQSPASSLNPMLEEAYFIETSWTSIPTVQFRHRGFANVLFCDWHVESMPMVPGSIDMRLPQVNVGRLNPNGELSLFQ